MSTKEESSLEEGTSEDSKSGSDKKIDIQKNKSELPFEDAFELTGQGKFNHCVLLTCGLIHLNVSMESVGMGYVVTSARCDLHLATEHKGFLNAAAFIGIISTSFIWGYLGDSKGRRGVMLPAMVCSSLLSIASAFSFNVWIMFSLRLLTGCFVSASSATVYAYLGEMHTAAHRAASIAWGAVFISFSFITLPGFAWLIIPQTWSYPVCSSLSLVPWRLFMLSWCVPGLLASLALYFLPESPKYLLAQQGPDKALPVLAKMYAFNHGTTVESFPVKRLLVSESTELSNQRVGLSGACKLLVLMFKPPLLRCVLIAHTSMFAVFMLSSGLYVWVPDILNSLLTSNSTVPQSVCHIIHDKFETQRNKTVSIDDECKTDIAANVFPISMGMGAVFAITYVLIGATINRIGKKTLYCSIMVACGILTVGGGLVPGSIVATMMLVLCLCSGCAASILAAIVVDVFPTNMRAMAMCVMYMVGRLGAAVGSNVLGATLDLYCHPAFIAFGVFSAGTALLILLWPDPQTIRDIMEKEGLSF